MNYPEARDEYFKSIIGAINRKPKKLTEKELKEIKEDYQNWRKSVYYRSEGPEG